MKLITHNNKILINSNNNILTSNYISSQPSKMFVGAANSNEMYYSLDGGNNWQQFDFGTYASSITYCGWAYFSKDGNYGVLVVLGVDVGWLTTDGGETWTVFSTPGDTANRFVTLSNDGKYILTGGFSNNSAGYFSNDYGSSFSRPNVLDNLSQSMSLSEQYMYIAPPNGHSEYYYSHDYGSTWTTVSLPGTNHKLVDCDESGQYVCIGYATYGTGVWFSNDYGQTITEINPNNGNIKISNDATQISYFDAQNNKIYTSVDKGNTWNNFTTPFDLGEFYSTIQVADTQNRTFFINVGQDSKIWEVTNNGNNYTQIFDFSTLGGSNVIRFQCGDNEIILLDTNKKLFKCNYDDVTDWQHIYTYPGISSAKFVSIK